MIVFGFIYGIATGNVDAVTEALTENAESGVTIALGLIGVMSLWLGIMKVAEDSGLINKIAKAIRPVVGKLLPDVKDNDKGIGAAVMTFAVDLIGAPNAGTPLGITAMNEFQKVNKHKDVASDSMVMFIAIVCSSLTIVPITNIAILSSADGTNVTNIIGPTLLATAVSTIVAIIAVKLLGKLPRYRIENFIEKEEGAVTEMEEEMSPEEEGE